jgi:hypothetical protein
MQGAIRPNAYRSLVFSVKSFTWLPLVVVLLSGCVPFTWAQADPLAGNASARLVVPKVPGDAYQQGLAIDPSGTRIAYASPAGIFIGNLGGSAQRVADAANNIANLVWSGDGRFLAYIELVTGPQCDASSCWATINSQRFAVKVLEIATGTLKVVAQDDGAHSLVAQPGGRFFAYQGSPYGLTLVRPEGAGSTEAFAPGFGISHFSWSPDGSLMEFDNLDDNGGGALHIVHAADKQIDTLSQSQWPAHGPLAVFWKADGMAVSVGEFSNGPNIVITEFPIGGGAPTHNAFNVSLPEGQGITNWGPLPDGRRIVGARAEPGRKYAGLSLLDPVTHSVKSFAPPVWLVSCARDGTTWVAKTVNGEGQATLYYLLTLP